VKIFVWVLKNFWFPILVAILGLLASKYPWAKKLSDVLKKL
jgi:hypothetical protein